MNRYLFSVFVLVLAMPCFAQEPLPTIESKTEGLEHREGFFDLYIDDDVGRLYLEVSDGGEPVLYRPILAGGLGSNDVGLDRGLDDGGMIVRFERLGRRVMLFEDNFKFRAGSDNPDERKAVDDAFARSILFGFDLVAKSGDRLLIDATAFVVRDALGIARALKQTDQGSFKLDESRSGLNPDVLKTFPDNTELEAWLTFKSDEPGPQVRDVTPDPYAVTLRIRHSFVRLPDDHYQPRAYDPRSGFFGITYVDYATPISAVKERRFIARHRLEVVDGRAVEPIVYYLDRGAPEPIRSALLDGANWWADAFESAGIKNAFRVELLPEGADPLDVRYNVIQWVHRSTRGWSWGGTVLDPRTGEIIAGRVRLGSLRVRQDYLIALGLVGDADQAADDDPMLKLALARLRQLAAHEVGHTLGLNHNFAASVSGRASVMDYPAPLVTVAPDGSTDLDSAYAVGIGAWDRTAIKYGYSVFDSDEDEAKGLEAILEAARKDGLQFISDEGARPTGGAHPQAHLWDNGSDPVAALKVDMDVRRAALKRLDISALKPGQPVAVLEEILVPLYLRHRYQIEAVSKLIGGVRYEYAVAGSDFAGPTFVAPDHQKAALSALLGALEPDELEIPLSVRSLILPRPPGYPQHRELFDGQTGLTFDAYTPAVELADFVFSLILDPARAARLTNQHIESPAEPGLGQIIGSVSASVRRRVPTENAYSTELRRLVEVSWIRALIRLAEHDDNPPTLAAVHGELARMAQEFSAAAADREPEAEVNHRHWLGNLIERYLDRDFDDEPVAKPAQLPPGSPIGTID